MYVELINRCRIERLFELKHQWAFLIKKINAYYSQKLLRKGTAQIKFTNLAVQLLASLVENLILLETLEIVDQ